MRVSSALVKCVRATMTGRGNNYWEGCRCVVSGSQVVRKSTQDVEVWEFIPLK